MSRFLKIQSNNAYPLDKQRNLLYYDYYNDGKAIDMSNSYLELVLDTSAMENKYNVVLGHGNFIYNTSCFIRSARMSSETKSNICEVNYVNIIDNNLNYYAEGSEKQLSRTLDGVCASWDSINEKFISAFNTTYNDGTGRATIRVPFKNLFLGGIGANQFFNLSNERIGFNFQLEPMYQMFMRAFNRDLYNQKPFDYLNKVWYLNGVAVSGEATDTILIDGDQSAYIFVGDLVRIEQGSNILLALITVVTVAEGNTTITIAHNLLHNRKEY